MPAAIGARVFPGVPFMFEHLRRSTLPPEAWPPCLQLLITAGARSTSTRCARFDARFGRKIHSFYGTSETGGICYDATPTDGDASRGPADARRHRVRDFCADDDRIPATPPGVGRIHVTAGRRGELRGYCRRPNTTASSTTAS